MYFLVLFDNRVPIPANLDCIADKGPEGWMVNDITKVSFLTKRLAIADLGPEGVVVELVVRVFGEGVSFYVPLNTVRDIVAILPQMSE